MEREGEIDGGGRLADAALAAGDRDNVLDAGQRQPAAAGLAARLAMGMTMRLGFAGPVGRGAVWGAARWAVSTTVAVSTPGRSMMAFSAALRTGSITVAWVGSTSIAKPTWPSRRVRPLTIPAATRSPPPGLFRPAAGWRGGIQDLGFGDGHA